MTIGDRNAPPEDEVESLAKPWHTTVAEESAAVHKSSRVRMQCRTAYFVVDTQALVFQLALPSLPVVAPGKTGMSVLPELGGCISSIQAGTIPLAEHWHLCQPLSRCLDFSRSNGCPVTMYCLAYLDFDNPDSRAVSHTIWIHRATGGRA